MAIAPELREQILRQYQAEPWRIGHAVAGTAHPSMAAQHAQPAGPSAPAGTLVSICQQAAKHCFT